MSIIRKRWCLGTVVVLAACGVPAGSGGAEVVATSVPSGAETALEQLHTSPRHGEWVQVAMGAGDSVRSWVVYPERSDPAPVVLVVHEIYGITHWIRAVADGLAADGFIAVAPDLLSGRGVPDDGSGEPEREAAVAAVRSLDEDEVHARLRAVATWAGALPAAADSYGIVGFCWGGAVAFEHAGRFPDLGTAVVYYGSSPEAGTLSGVRAPVLGLYGGDDARVNATIARADSVLSIGDRTFEVEIYEGAGHGFLRQQDGREGANRRASEAAWPRTIDWLRFHLEDR
jgi:carboxymethylenebutenolidase